MLQSVSKSYGSTSVLHEISAAFQPARVSALVGPNGAGKTTLLRIIAGLQSPSGGKVDSAAALYFGGGETLPVRGTINGLRRAFSLGPVADGGRRLRNLSRGQLHAVGLDIAFLLARPILLLDEPWSSLEPDARSALNARITEYAHTGAIVLCSSHELDEVGRIADDVAFLRRGQLAVYHREEAGGERFAHAQLLARYRGEI